MTSSPLCTNVPVVLYRDYTTTFIRYSFFSTEKRIKRNKNFNRRLRRLIIFLFLILIFWENEGQKGGIDNPHLLSISKNKNITFYIYHHIDTQPTESHFADCTPPAHLDHGATRSSSLLGCFSCFYRYWQMKRQVSQTCLHSFTIIYLLWFVDCVLATWPTRRINL